MPLCTDISELGKVAKACPRCIELTTELVAAQHELYEAGKRETEAILRYSQAEERLAQVKEWALRYLPGGACGEVLELLAEREN